MCIVFVMYFFPGNPDPTGSQFAEVKNAVLTGWAPANRVRLSCPLHISICRTCHLGCCAHCQVSHHAGHDLVKNIEDESRYFYCECDDPTCLAHSPPGPDAKVGVFVDFCCLPQEPRSPDEARGFKGQLGQLNTLLAPDTITLVLSEGSNDFVERAWCVWELHFSTIAPRFVILSREMSAALQKMDLGRGQRAFKAFSRKTMSGEALNIVEVHSAVQHLEALYFKMRDLKVEAPLPTHHHTYNNNILVLNSDFGFLCAGTLCAGDEWRRSRCADGHCHSGEWSHYRQHGSQTQLLRFHQAHIHTQSR